MYYETGVTIYNGTMIKTCTILIFLLISVAQAQNKNVADSLLHKLAIARDTGKIQILLALSDQYSFTDISKSIKYGSEALKEAQRLNYETGIGHALGKLAETYSRTNSEGKALELMFQLLHLEQKFKNSSGEAAALLSIGNMYNRLGAYPNALDYYFKSLRIYKKLRDRGKTVITLWNIGNVYKTQNDSKALDYYMQSAKQIEEESGNYADQVMIYTSIGFYYKQHRQPDSAIVYFKKSLQNARKIPSEFNAHAVTMALTNIGSVFETADDYNQALAYNQKALNEALKRNNKMLLGLSYENRGRIYHNLNQYKTSTLLYSRAANIYKTLGIHDHLSIVENMIADNHLAEKRYDSANYYAAVALRNAESNDLPYLAEEALRELVKINKETGRYDSALKFQEQIQDLRDTLFNREKIKQLAMLGIVYETEQKQEQIRLLQMEQKQNRNLSYFLFSGIIVLLFIGGLLYYQQRVKNRKDRVIHASQELLLNAKLKITQLHEQQLQKEIEGKNKELTSKSLNLVQKNQMLEDLRNSMREIRKTAGENLSGQLVKLDHFIKQNFDLDKDWDEFHLYFENVHALFFKELSTRFPELTNKDLRLCALLKLNLSSKEIAALTGISPSSVKMARYRLRKKLCLESEDDMVTFLVTLERSLTIS